MQGPTPRSVLLTVLAYSFVSFAVQAASHFAINASHYASIPIMRSEPIMALGISAMVIQGALAGLLFPAVRWGAASIRTGLLFAWVLGAFLASYIVLVEPGKYTVPSVSAWMRVEGLAALIQFTAFGLLLGLIHRGPAPERASAT